MNQNILVDLISIAEMSDEHLRTRGVLDELFIILVFCLDKRALGLCDLLLEFLFNAFLLLFRDLLFLYLVLHFKL
jgi:hypothetical protein